MPIAKVKSRSDLQLESLQTRIQTIAALEDKNKALEQLEQILKPSNPIKLPLDLQFKAIDLRCALHTSLNNLDLAAKDGKSLCRLKETNCKGYIRLAKILAKKGEHDKVTRLYDLGLEKVPAGTREHEGMAKMREKWVTELARRRKRCDMFEFLPAEILDEILSYVSFRDVVQFWAVCKSWHLYIDRRPHLWRKIDLRDSKPINTKQLICCLKKGKGTVQELRLGKMQDAAFDKIVRLIGQAAKYAKVLEFSDFKRMLPREFPMSTGALVGLRELYLARAKATDVAEILKRVSELEVMEVKDVVGEEVNWDDCIAPLKRLKVGKVGQGPYRDALELERWAELISLPSLKHLNSLYISSAPSTTTEPLPLFHNLTELTSLHLISAYPLGPFIDLPSTLTHLTINQNYKQQLALIDPSLFTQTQPFFVSFPNLTHLDLADSKITFPEVLMLLKSSKPVSINLNDCSRCMFNFDEFKHAVDVQDVEELFLAGVPGIDDQISEEFSPASYMVKSFNGGACNEEFRRGFENLKRVDLSSTNISGIGLLNVIRTGRDEVAGEGEEEQNGKFKLEWVRVHACSRIAYDARDIARKRYGVRVIEK